jgi:hypothetical protein
VAVDWPTVLLSNAIDLHQTLGLLIEEMTAATHAETMLIPTFHLQVLERTEIEVGHLEATAGGHVVQRTEAKMIHTFHLQDDSRHVEMTVQDHL